MEAVEALARLGGAASRATLLRLTTARRLRTAIADGSVRRAGRGRYRLPDVDLALRRAAEFGGVVSHASAAQLHGWEVASTAWRPWITLPRNATARPMKAQVAWRALAPEEHDGFVTSPMRTVIDCARDLPFPEALAIADSALRAGDVDAQSLVRAAAAVRGPGAPQARRVADHASALAANPFESVLRALALEVGLDVRPQVGIDVGTTVLHPDVVDEGRRLVLEAESFEWHGGRDAFDRDCWRYTRLVACGWTVLRFTWWQVMHDPEWVRDQLRATTGEGTAARARPS